VPNSIPIESYQANYHTDRAKPMTEDVIKVILLNNLSVNGKSFLFISSNPYICYHDAVAKKVLKPHGVTVETVGDTQHQPVENVLDTVARCLINLG